MKKMMILTFAVLGMVLGSFAVVQPAMAREEPCTETIADPYGCAIRICGECIATFCEGGVIPACGPTITP
tara:strand:+ start:117 stop:326 length:210 start_codon:yes stop_codon:yes gene_type:complete